METSNTSTAAAGSFSEQQRLKQKQKEPLHPVSVQSKLEQRDLDNKPLIKPHRCDDRLEDLIQALFEGNIRKKVPGPAKLFWRCLRSKPGEEPREPFYFYKPPSSEAND